LIDEDMISSIVFPFPTVWRNG